MQDTDQVSENHFPDTKLELVHKVHGQLDEEVEIKLDGQAL
jgi:hypothetical protein